MTTTDRDYAGEMRKVINAAMAEGDYIPRQLATEIVEKLRANDSELLKGWLDAQAEHFVWQAVNDQNRSIRSHVRQTHKRSVFRKAADAHATGKASALVDYLGMRFTVADGMRKTLGSLKAEDLAFVGNDYERRERDNGFWKIFIRALEKKVGPHQSVGDLYSNEQLAEMFDSLKLN